jgi:hypothetical protein
VPRHSGHAAHAAPHAAVEAAGDPPVLGSRRVFNSRIRTAQFACLTLGGWALTIGPPTEFYPNDAVAIRRWMIVSALVFWTAGIRVLRLAIVVDGQSLVVRNFLRYYHLDVGEIARFEAPSLNLRHVFKAGLKVVRTSEKWISSSAFVVSPAISPAMAAWPVADLNAWLLRGGDGIVQAQSLSPVRAWLWRVWLGLLLLFAAIVVASVVAGLVDPIGFANA